MSKEQHATAGFAALASVFYVGSRKYNKITKPNNIPLMAIGTALLWFGWYGFNAGSELNVDGITSLAFLNSDIAASFAAITWMIIEWYKERKPKFVGLMTGAVAGLATITPAAGLVSLPVAALMGILGSVVCYFAVHLKNKMEWDDALDVWGVHGCSSPCRQYRIHSLKMRIEFTGLQAERLSINIFS